MLASPVPTQMVLGWESGIANAPIDIVGISSKMGSQVTPVLVVFHKPPVAVPM